MFSKELEKKIFNDKRLIDVPIIYISTVMSVIEESLEARFYSDEPYLSKDEILDEVCRRY